MATKLVMSDEDDASNNLSRQAISFFVHILIALGAWFGFMLVGTAINPVGVPQGAILLMSAAIPLAIGYLVVRRRPSTMAEHIWLAGLIWVLIISLWILDMPTGPNMCNECGASDKLVRTLFSLPEPSGLIDNNGPFFCTWPAAALMGYAIGARLARRN